MRIKDWSIEARVLKDGSLQIVITHNSDYIWGQLYEDDDALIICATTPENEEKREADGKRNSKHR